MKIWTNTLVKNEERYIWYCLMSVAEHVDKMLVWDTGSTDDTVAIIKEVRKKFPKKIVFDEVGEVDPVGFTKLSQKMLEKTESDWFLILDGDEVWWDDSIISLIKIINEKGDSLETIVQPYYNLIGDIFHYQEKAAGMYEFDKKRGHLNIRALNRKIPRLHFEKEHGQRGLYDRDGCLIQERNTAKRIFLDSYYLHFTNMPRSLNRQKDLSVPKRGFKYKHELGISFPLDFYYPEVFFLDRPVMVPSPWEKRSKNYQLKAAIQTPLKYLKRRVYKPPKSGY